MDFKKIKSKLPTISYKIKRRIGVIIFIKILIFVLLFVAINQFPLTGKITDTETYSVIPLNPEQREKVEQSILASEFIKDIPKNDPVFLRFFSFENGERVWQDGFLVGREKILTQGKPSIYFSIHSKYIFELNEQDLCSTIKRASSNGDVGIHSDYNKARLFLKYAGMLKYKECFEF